MKAKLTYNLPEDEKAFVVASLSNNLLLALWEVEQYLRKVDKYETGETIEEIRNEFYRILDTHNIHMDNLIE